MKTNFAALSGKGGIVVITHKLFGNQKFRVERLSVIDDDERIGIRIHNQDIYIEKIEVVSLSYDDNVFKVTSKYQTITIIMNKM